MELGRGLADGKLLREVLGEQGHIFQSIPQGRQLDADDVEAVVEIFAESSFAHHLVERPVRGRDQADFDVDRLGPADAFDPPLLDHP